MNTHDVLAYAVASEAIRRVRTSAAPWNTIFSANAYVTSSRTWPLPDFVLVDQGHDLTIGVEFKPPRQSKREYLTGLGQAIAYARDFNYGILVLPIISDDGYPIAEHVREVLVQPSLADVPVGLLQYDPSTISPYGATFDEAHFFAPRIGAPHAPAPLDSSFYAKWREISPEELFSYISFSYDETRAPSAIPGTIRDRAFELVWREIQANRLHHWGGGLRYYANTVAMRTGVMKNYRNFARHLGWTEATGSLTEDGLKALHVGALYGPNSRPFLDRIATSALVEGKHLVLFNAISEFQDSIGIVPSEIIWLADLETFLEDKGLLKRNPGRAGAAVANSARQFLKAEKQFWRGLELIVPRGKRVFHPGRGFIFNWSRITSLLQSAN